jgi:hypothetical protein
MASTSTIAVASGGRHSAEVSESTKALEKRESEASHRAEREPAKNGEEAPQRSAHSTRGDGAEHERDLQARGVANTREGRI